MLASIIGGLFGRCLAPACRRLGLLLACSSGVLVKLFLLSQSAVYSVQFGYVVSEAQEKPSVSFI